MSMFAASLEEHDMNLNTATVKRAIQGGGKTTGIYIFFYKITLIMQNNQEIYVGALATDLYWILLKTYLYVENKLREILRTW